MVRKRLNKTTKKYLRGLNTGLYPRKITSEFRGSLLHNKEESNYVQRNPTCELIQDYRHCPECNGAAVYFCRTRQQHSGLFSTHLKAPFAGHRGSLMLPLSHDTKTGHFPARIRRRERLEQRHSPSTTTCQRRSKGDLGLWNQQPTALKSNELVATTQQNKIWFNRISHEWWT